MDILVKGMNMPTACRHGECSFACSAAYQTGLICIVRKQYVVPGDIPIDCPCSLVPTHGRCVDADVLYEIVKKRTRNWAGGWNDIECVLTGNDIKNAPTIIPADERTDIQKEFLQN